MGSEHHHLAFLRHLKLPHDQFNNHIGLLFMEQQTKAPPEIQKAALFLRSSGAGIKVRVGAMNGKRLDYFKGLFSPVCFNKTWPLHSSWSGKSAIKALLSPAYQKAKGVRPISSEEEAKTVLSAVNAFAFFLRVSRGAPSGASSSSPKNLTLIQDQTFAPDEYYAWFYDGSQWTTYAGGILMVVLMLAGVMFPLWPPVLRLGVWYLSMGMLGLVGLFFVIAIIRLIFYIITVVVVSPGIWIFPKLFADVGFVSFFLPWSPWCFAHADGCCRLSRSYRYGSGMKRRSRKRRQVKRRGKGRRKRNLRAKRRAITVLLMFLRTSKRWTPVIPVPADEPPESRRCKTRMHSPTLDLPAVNCIYSVLRRISLCFGSTAKYK
jgi:translocation protein SEC62